MWYVIQTLTGKEEDLIKLIRDIVPKELYSECFSIYYERVWRKQQKSVVHIERMFPGYVFVITDFPEDMFLQLKQVPAMSKLIADGGYTFLTLYEDEIVFLKNILNEDKNNTVRLSYVETNGRGKVLRVSGPLQKYMDKVVRFQFKKRFVIIDTSLSRQKKTVVLGIILQEDVQQEIAYGRVVSLEQVPAVYHIQQDCAEIQEEDSILRYQTGDLIEVIEGPLKGMHGLVIKANKKCVEVGVQMFGQEMAIEIPIESVCIENEKK